MQPLRGIILRVACVVGLTELGFATVIPLLPLYLTERLGASVRLVGTVVAAFALVETLLKATSGSLADRIGRRPLIIGGLLLSSLAPLVMSVLRVPVLFVPLRVIDGAGSSTLWPAAAAIVVDTTPPDRRATAMGALNMFFLAGLACGPALGLFVVGMSGSYEYGFYLASALLASAAVVAMFALRGLGDTHLRPPETEMVGYHGVAANPHLTEVVQSARISPLLRVMLGVAVIRMFGVGLLAPILAIYAKRILGLSEHIIGTLFLVVVLSVAAVSVPAGKLADRWGKRKTVAWGMAVGSLGMWALPASPRIDVLAAAAVLIGISYAVAEPAWYALVGQLAPPGRVGLAMGAAQTAEGVGLVLGPLIGGLLWDTAGHRAPFVACALLLSIATVTLLISIRRYSAS